MSLSSILVLFSHAPVVLVAAYLWLKQSRYSRPIQTFGYFLYLNALVQISALIFSLFGINNLPLLHILVPVGCCFLIAFYAAVLKGFIDKWIFLITCVIFVLFSLINSIFFQPLFSFNSYALTVESILLVILAISTYLLFVMESGNGVVSQSSSVLNWINSGLFIYHSSSLIIFYFGKAIIERFSPQFVLYTWVIHSILSIIMYICFFIGLWKQPKN